MKIEMSRMTNKTGASPALSFVTATPVTKAHKGSNVVRIFKESHSLTKTLADNKFPAKQSNKRERRSTNADSEVSRSGIPSLVWCYNSSLYVSVSASMKEDTEDREMVELPGKRWRCK